MAAVEGDAGGATGSIDEIANMINHNEKVRETCGPANVGSTRRFDHAQLIRTDLPEAQNAFRRPPKKYSWEPTFLLSH
ncbi:hypothetical protein HAP47_0022185 [Bradyrhizobium sp. 41S5]|uniref:hypothetical protein n=1 Tax=Bradyrhizobium sp. 41S5 TaxID=1404443 RepID=UPI00156BB008|nr:hypothetical protein [Bradyrhizobium sp. 41S5]UFX42005.1 hypothetical protein HAP47_0022185 [Bradyrhizobium sp. 41S5]